MPNAIKCNPDPWIQKFLNASVKRCEIAREDLQPHAMPEKAQLQPTIP
jgi:hypothetical protein